MVISTLISTDKFKEALELLFLQIKLEKAASINFRDHVKFLLLRGEVNNAFSILENYPMPVKKENFIRPNAQLVVRLILYLGRRDPQHLFKRQSA